MRDVRHFAVLFALLSTTACKGDERFTDAAAGDDSSIDGGAGALAFPAAVEVGLVGCGASLSRTFDVENAGGADVDYLIESSNPDLFTVTPVAGTVLAGTTTTFTVTAAVPADSGAGVAVTGQLTITTTPDASPAIIEVSAVPQGGTITVSPAAATFGDVELGLSGVSDIEIANTGNAAVGVAIAAPSDDDYAVAFASGALAAAGTSTATVTYTPGGLGATTASAAITITGATCGPVPASIDMTGTGAPDGGVLVTGSTAFGDVDCGAAAGTTSITLTNDGNIPATWTSSFLADGQSDGDRYALSATSGTIAAGQAQTVTLTRLAIARPATPRAYDVTLRIVTAGQVTQNHDLAITQALHGPVLTAGPATLDFGYAPVGQTLTSAVTVTNSGDRAATATFTESGTGFAVPQSGATIAIGGGASTLTASYAPTALGDTTGAVAVTAPGSCSAALSVPLAAGIGPWSSFSNTVAFDNCSNGAGGGSGAIYIHNPGNQPLSVSGCIEASATDLDPEFYGQPIMAGSGNGSGTLVFTWKYPVPLRSGATAATFRCNTNEKHFTTRDFTVTRTMSGMDLTLTALDGAFAFDCSAGGGSKSFRVTNSGNVGGYIYASGSLPSPFYSFGGATLGVDASSDVFGVGSGSGACTPGTGSIGVGTGSANVCSVTPLDFPVTVVP